MLGGMVMENLVGSTSIGAGGGNGSNGCCCGKSAALAVTVKVVFGAGAVAEVVANACGACFVLLVLC